MRQRESHNEVLDDVAVFVNEGDIGKPVKILDPELTDALLRCDEKAAYLAKLLHNQFPFLKEHPDRMQIVSWRSGFLVIMICMSLRSKRSGQRRESATRSSCLGLVWQLTMSTT